MLCVGLDVFVQEIFDCTEKDLTALPPWLPLSIILLCKWAKFPKKSVYFQPSLNDIFHKYFPSTTLQKYPKRAMQLAFKKNKSFCHFQFYRLLFRDFCNVFVSLMEIPIKIYISTAAMLRFDIDTSNL